MNQNEKKILNGVYRNYEIINDGIFYEASELNWLLENQLCRASEWRKQEGNFNSIENEMTETENWLSQLSLLNHKIEKALSFLKAKGYIDYIKQNNAFKISVTSAGCEVARKLQTRSGRIDLWYHDNKDGVIWILITVLTSAIVTVITALIIDKLK